MREWVGAAVLVVSCVGFLWLIGLAGYVMGETEQKQKTCEIAGGVLVRGWCVNRGVVIVLDKSQAP